MTAGPNSAADASPRISVDQALAQARRAGDPRAEAIALTDLGVLALREGDAATSAHILEQAVALARQLGDRAAESDALSHLGMAVLTQKQARLALQYFEQSLAAATAVQARLERKNALDRLGNAYSSMRQPRRALGFYQEAQALSRELDDREHEATLTWQLALQHAELGERDEALRLAGQAVQLFKSLRHPQAATYQEHLRQFTHSSGAESGALAQAYPAAGGNPSLLRMAVSAANALAAFIGSGLETTPEATRQARLAVCAACEHHTGTRCRLCGCITVLKARLPREFCPAGKWPVIRV
jgi:tetratricopeptide (TPR) repeat protein